ncbi:M48 family metallopeptidase [Sphingosinicella microcystinivorans]|uniref:M48 family metallopeptidase n=1 Tax=Sphingosinicella microcystinivorans TaxID=335406 RepID=UPI0022F3BA03|nr:M48 family metallopeptidase [Sphingosinicella microcystinivorans]WBX84794.1 M48 family metallopeptidase [Sphingosinicella microcystinivorans]
MTHAWLYDGESALRRSVTLGAREGALEIAGEDGSARVSPADLVFIESRPGETIYGRKDKPGWRLGVAAPIPGGIAALLPQAERYGGWIDRVGLWRATAIGLAVSAAVLFAVYQLPHWLAPLVPDRVMKAYGNAMVGDFGGKFCAGPGGQQALDALTRRLAPGIEGLNIRVVDLPVVNAAALPGDNIVIFDELLKEAKSPEEFAGVLAHEIAHIEHRDVAEAMVRELGLGLVLTTLGGDVAGNVHGLLSLSYSRDAEAAADAEAIAMMNRARISPAPTAGFFERLAKSEDAIGRADMLVYLSSHPVSKGRAAAFRKGAVEDNDYTPALSRDEWDALVDICHNDPDRRD